MLGWRGGRVGWWGLYRECYVACMTWHVSEAGGGLDLWPRAPKLGRWEKGIGWEGFASKQGLLFRPLQECQFHKKMPTERKRQKERRQRRIYLSIDRSIYLPIYLFITLSHLVSCGQTALIILMFRLWPMHLTKRRTLILHPSSTFIMQRLLPFLLQTAVMRSGNKLTSGPWLKAEPLWLSGRGELQQNSVDAAPQGLSQEITLFFSMSSWSWREGWMNARHDPEKACNLFPCREKLDISENLCLWTDVIFKCVQVAIRRPVKIRQRESSVQRDRR